eukprot:scaffold68336_cov67-Phaeocystis_antarctica.AAC.1
MGWMLSRCGTTNSMGTVLRSRNASALSPLFAGSNTSDNVKARLCGSAARRRCMIVVPERGIETM